MPRPRSSPSLISAPDGYRIRWWEGERRRERRCRARDRASADREFAAWLLAAAPRGAGDPAEARISDVIGRYLVEHAAHGPSAATAAHNAQALASWWGSRPVAEVTPATCRAYAQSRRRDGRSAATVRRELSVLSAALRHEVREGRLTSAPAVPMPAPPPARDRWLTRSEVASLLRAAKANPQRRRGAGRFILLALYTGARRQALLDLRWSQIDLERGVLDLNPPGRTQTTKGRPRLPIPRRLMTFLKIWGRGADRDEPVIGRRGQAVQGVRTGFRAAVAEAGLEGVTPHTLRHTAATWLAQAGVPLWQIAGWLGHSVARTTERYAHHHPAYLAEARDALDRRASR